MNKVKTIEIRNNKKCRLDIAGSPPFPRKNNHKLKNLPLSGSAEVPGDKSISQRALIIGLISIGQTVIKGILDSEDVYYTLKAVEALGAKVDINKNTKTITTVSYTHLTLPTKRIV